MIVPEDGMKSCATGTHRGACVRAAWRRSFGKIDLMVVHPSSASS